MKTIAPAVHLLDGTPTAAINVYLLGDVLVDAGTRHAAGRILRQLDGHAVRAVALTHGHADHQGAAHAVCTTLGVPLWCGTGDADGVEAGDLRPLGPDTRLVRTMIRAWAGPAQPVARRLAGGDEVAGFTVLDAPGHSPGQVAFWREEDGVLVLGDVLFNRHRRIGKPTLGLPPAAFTLDEARNRRSARRLLELDPQIVCFGHGPPVTAGPALDALKAHLGARAAAVV